MRPGEAPRLVAGARRWMLAGLMAIGIGQALATLASAWLVHTFFAHGLRDVRPSAAALVLALVGCGAILAALRTLERVRAERMGQHYAAELRQVLFDSLAGQSPRRLQSRSRGGTVMRIMGDVGGVRRWVSLGVPRIAVGALAAGVALAALAWLDPWLAGAALCGFALAGVALAGLSARVEPAVREARRRQMHLAADVNDRVAAIAVVQVFDQVARERRRLGRRSEALAAAMVDQTRGVALLRSAAEFGGALASALVLLAGVVEVGRGAATLAQVVAALTVVGLIAPTFRELGQVLGYWRSAGVSLAKIEAFLAAPRLDCRAGGESAPGVSPSAAATVEFRAVTVEGALRDFSAAVPAGRRIAIVGPNGAGKSTLLALVARLVEPDGGELLVDGRAVQSWPLSVLRARLGVVMPDLPLLRGTILRNLAYRAPRAAPEEMTRLAQLCGIDDMLATLPRGGLTRVGEGGGQLSYGQRQRIAWARALLGGPGLLLLDEADANLDPVSATRLGEVLDGYHGTVLMVTHRLERTMRADEVWFLEDGRLVERGSPRELMAAPSRMRELFRRELALAG